MAIKQTPIYEIEKQANAKFVEQDGWQVAQSYGNAARETAVSHTHVTLCDQTHNGKIWVEGKTAVTLFDADHLAIGEGDTVIYGDLYRLRQDLFFISTSAEGLESNVASLTRQATDNPDLVTVTDITHGNAELWLIGPKSAELLIRLCGLDFDDSQFPDGAAKQTSVAKTKQLIIRHDMNELPVYALIGSRSLAAYLWQTIMGAGQDLNIQPIGQAAMQKLEPLPF